MKARRWLLPLVLLAACDKTDQQPQPSAGAEESAKAGSTAAPPKEDKPAPVGKEPFAAFGNFINQASDAVLAAARGEKPDDKWGLEPLDGSHADKLKGAKHAFTTAEVEAMSDKHGYIRTNVVVFPDNRVRWVKLQHRDKAFIKPTAGLEAASPMLAGTTKTFVDILTGDDCTLPLLAQQEASKLPGGAEAFRDASPQLEAACKAMAGKTGEWMPRYDDFTVVLEAAGKTVMVRSSIQVKGGKLVLGKPRVR